MREQAMAILAQILANNIGNRLTEEMATGIATTLNHHLMQVEVKPVEVGEVGEGLPTLEPAAAE